MIDRSENIPGGFRWSKAWPDEVLALELERVMFTFDYLIKALKKPRPSPWQRNLIQILQDQAPVLSQRWSEDLERMDTTGRVPDDLHSANLGISFDEHGRLEIAIFDPILKSWHPSFADLHQSDADLNAAEFRRFHMAAEFFDLLGYPIRVPPSMR